MVASAPLADSRSRRVPHSGSLRRPYTRDRHTPETPIRLVVIDVEIEAPGVAAADTLADSWVALAHEQYAHGSKLSAEENRAAIREEIVREIVTGGVLVAHATGDDESTDGSTADGTTPAGGEIVGFVTFGPETGSYHQNVARGTIRNLYVEPDHRNAGIGSALIEAAEDALAEDGIEVVALDAMAENDAARRLYRRHGYTPHRVELAKRIESDTH